MIDAVDGMTSHFDARYFSVARGLESARHAQPPPLHHTCRCMPSNHSLSSRTPGTAVRGSSSHLASLEPVERWRAVHLDPDRRRTCAAEASNPLPSGTQSRFPRCYTFLLRLFPIVTVFYVFFWTDLQHVRWCVMASYWSGEHSREKLLVGHLYRAFDQIRSRSQMRSVQIFQGRKPVAHRRVFSLRQKVANRCRW